MKSILWNIIGLAFLFMLDVAADALKPEIINNENYQVRIRAV